MKKQNNQPKQRRPAQQSPKVVPITKEFKPAVERYCQNFNYNMSQLLHYIMELNRDMKYLLPEFEKQLEEKGIRSK